MSNGRTQGEIPPKFDNVLHNHEMAREIAAGLSKEFHEKFLNGAADHGWGPFSRYPTLFYLRSLGEELLDGFAYLWMLRERLFTLSELALQGKVALKREDDSEIRRILERMVERFDVIAGHHSETNPAGDPDSNQKEEGRGQ